MAVYGCHDDDSAFEITDIDVVGGTRLVIGCSEKSKNWHCHSSMIAPISLRCSIYASLLVERRA